MGSATKHPRPPAVVLLGGKGTRIAGTFPDRPKALVPVLDRPFLEWQLDCLATWGFTRIILAAGHMADRLSDWLDFSLPERFRVLGISLSVEPAPLGTAGALLHALPQIPQEAPRLFAVNGDTLFPALDTARLDAILGKIDASPPDAAHLFVAPIEKPDRYGTVEFDGESGRVTAFREKHPVPSGFVNAGGYLFPVASLRNLLPLASDSPLSMERDVFPALVVSRTLYAHPIPPPLLDMGTPEGLAALSGFLDAARHAKRAEDGSEFVHPRSTGDRKI